MFSVVIFRREITIFFVAVHGGSRLLLEIQDCPHVTNLTSTMPTPVLRPWDDENMTGSNNKKRRVRTIALTNETAGADGAIRLEERTNAMDAATKHSLPKSIGATEVAIVTAKCDQTSKAKSKGAASIKKADKLNLPYFQLESVSRCDEAKKDRPPFVPIYSRIAADLIDELVKERSLKIPNNYRPKKKMRDWIKKANDNEKDKSCTFSVRGTKNNRADFPYDEWKITIHLTTATICEDARFVEGDRAKAKTA